MWALDQLDAIDYLIAQRLSDTTQMGTVVARTSTTDALIVLDGSQGALPCKVSHTADAYEGDRVGVVKFGRHWVILSSLNWRGARPLTVANRAARPTQNLTYGDRIRQQDTNVESWWDGTTWRPVGGQVLYSHARGYMQSNTYMSNQAAGTHVLIATPFVECEPGVLYNVDYLFHLANGGFATGTVDSLVSVAVNGGSLYNDLARSGVAAITASALRWPMGMVFPFYPNGGETSFSVQISCIHTGGNADVTADGVSTSHLSIVAGGPNRV